jgi:hypothetical protein
MKKILLLFTALGALTLSSCNNDDDNVAVVGTDTIAEVFELNNVNFVPDADGNYQITYVLDPVIFGNDVVLVYRLTGTDPQGNDVWSLTPNFVYNDFGEVRYTSDFSLNSVAIYLDSDYLITQTPALLQNQVFRIVIVPGSTNGQAKAAKVDYKDYNAVIKQYGINDSNVKTLNVK